MKSSAQLVLRLKSPWQAVLAYNNLLLWCTSWWCFNYELALAILPPSVREKNWKLCIKQCVLVLEFPSLGLGFFLSLMVAVGKRGSWQVMWNLIPMNCIYQIIACLLNAACSIHVEWGESPLSVICKLLLRKPCCTETGTESCPCVNLPALCQAWKETLGFIKTTTTRVAGLSTVGAVQLTVGPIS